MDVELRDRLEARLQAVGHPSATVTDIERLTGGASRQIWRVRTDQDGQWADFILRMDHPSDADPDGNTREVQTIMAAVDAGVLTPPVLDHSSDPDVLGAPFILLSFVEGEGIPRRILRDDRFVRAREKLPAQLGRALGQISKADIDGLALPVISDPVEDLVEYSAEWQVNRPVLELGLRELDRRRPEPAPRRALIHGDFRLGNFMIDDDGLAAVIDWEIAHVGDPFEDLGYVCMRAWRYGGPGRFAGFGDVEDVLAAYEAETGFRPTDAQLAWWEARATAWWAITCIRQLRRAVPHHASELELLAIGRRAAEPEYDLLTMLYPDVEPEPYAPAPPSSTESAPLFTDPPALTLLTGLERFLGSDSFVEGGASNRFRARVAHNVARILRREHETGEAANRWFASRLAALGAATEADLSERIRGLADTSPQNPEAREIVAVLKTATQLRLAVWNPQYAELPLQMQEV